MARSPYPKCIVKGCRKRAKRWDGGECGYVFKDYKSQPACVIWLCADHDPHHKSFDLPDTLEGAIRDLVYLREQLQKEFRRAFKAEDKLAREKLVRWAPKEFK